MTSKKANRLFLTMISAHIGVVLFLSFFGKRINIGIVANFFLGEAILMVPALLFLLLKRSKSVLTEGVAAPPPVCSMAFHRVKISTLLMIVVVTVLLRPLVTVLNILTLFFTDNAVAAIEGDILSLPFPVMLFMIGIFAPFCEEFVFRGIIYRSYADNGGFWPVLLSALTFGLMHMNFNQAVYAFAIGIFLAVLVEAAGSLWASIFCHMFFNSYEVVMMYLMKAMLGNTYMEAVNKAADEMAGIQLQAGFAVYLIIAAVTTPIAVCCVVWIAKNEGRQEEVQAMFRRRNIHAAEQQLPQMPADQKKAPLITAPLIVAIVLCLGCMSLEWFLV